MLDRLEQQRPVDALGQIAARDRDAMPAFRQQADR